MHWSVYLLPVSSFLIRQTIRFSYLEMASPYALLSSITISALSLSSPFPFFYSHLSITLHLSFSSSRHFSLYLPLLHMTFSVPHFSLKYSMQIFSFVPHFLHFSSLSLFHVLSSRQFVNLSTSLLPDTTIVKISIVRSHSILELSSTPCL